MNRNIFFLSCVTLTLMYSSSSRPMTSLCVSESRRLIFGFFNSDMVGSTSLLLWQQLWLMSPSAFTQNGTSHAMRATNLFFLFFFHQQIVSLGSDWFINGLESASLKLEIFLRSQRSEMLRGTDTRSMSSRAPHSQLSLISSRNMMFLILRTQSCLSSDSKHHSVIIVFSRMNEMFSISWEEGQDYEKNKTTASIASSRSVRTGHFMTPFCSL